MVVRCSCNHMTVHVFVSTFLYVQGDEVEPFVGGGLMGEEVVGDGIGDGAVRHRRILGGIDSKFIDVYMDFE